MIRTIAIAGLSSIATAAFFMSGMATQPTGVAFAAATGQAFPHEMFAAQLPPEVRGLGQLNPGERFKHFAGIQAHFTDLNNVSHNVSVIPGTAQSVSADSLTIAPNDMALGASKTYKLTSDTIIRKAAQPWTGGQASAQVAVGDSVAVIAFDGDQPRAVIVGGPDGFGPGRFGPGWVHQGR
jgi:hypothetical protein